MIETVVALLTKSRNTEYKNQWQNALEANAPQKEITVPISSTSVSRLKQSLRCTWGKQVLRK